MTPNPTPEQIEEAKNLAYKCGSKNHFVNVDVIAAFLATRDAANDGVIAELRKEQGWHDQYLDLAVRLHKAEAEIAALNARLLDLDGERADACLERDALQEKIEDLKARVSDAEEQEALVFADGIHATLYHRVLARALRAKTAELAELKKKI